MSWNLGKHIYRCPKLNVLFIISGNANTDVNRMYQHQHATLSISAFCTIHQRLRYKVCECCFKATRLVDARKETNRYLYDPVRPLLDKTLSLSVRRRKRSSTYHIAQRGIDWRQSATVGS